MVCAQPAELPFAFFDLLVKGVDELERRRRSPAPGLGHLQALKEVASSDTEQIRERTRFTVRDEGGVDAVLERDPVSHQMQAEPSTLALGTNLRGGKPDGRHEIPARELGQHPRVDAVGLAGQGREALDLLGVGDLNVPTEALEGVVYEASTVHRLDGGPYGSAQPCDIAHQAPQRLHVGSYRRDLDRLPFSSSTWTSSRLRLKSNPACNTSMGPPPWSSFDDNQRLPSGGPSS
jgi:hypothetical protein